MMKLDSTKMMLLLGLGIGAYFLTMKKATAGQVGSTARPAVQPRYSASPNAYSPVGPAQANAVGWGQTIGSLVSLFGGSKAPAYTTQLPGDQGSSDGWTRYSDGTSISPLGEYYFNGSKTWSPYGADSAAVNLVNQYDVGAYIPLPE